MRRIELLQLASTMCNRHIELSVWQICMLLDNCLLCLFHKTVIQGTSAYYISKLLFFLTFLSKLAYNHVKNSFKCISKTPLLLSVNSTAILQGETYVCTLYLLCWFRDAKTYYDIRYNQCPCKVGRVGS